MKSRNIYIKTRIESHQVTDLKSSALLQLFPKNVQALSMFSNIWPYEIVSDIFTLSPEPLLVTPRGTHSGSEAQVELQKLAELVPGPVQPGPGQQLGAGQSSTTSEDTGTALIREHTDTTAASCK